MGMAPGTVHGCEIDVWLPYGGKALKGRSPPERTKFVRSGKSRPEYASHFQADPPHPKTRITLAATERLPLFLPRLKNDFLKPPVNDFLNYLMILISRRRSFGASSYSGRSGLVAKIRYCRNSQPHRAAVAMLATSHCRRPKRAHNCHTIAKADTRSGSSQMDA